LDDVVVVALVVVVVVVVVLVAMAGKIMVLAGGTQNSISIQKVG